MQVKEVMTSDPACCTPETSLKEVAKLMVAKDCGAIPVVENQTNRRVVGVVTDRDIVCRAIALGRNPSQMIAREVMTTPVTSLSTQASLAACVRIMEWKRVRRIPIVDRKGRCCGIVAQADVARRAREYETAELVRDVSMGSHPITM